jgi:hypothetical protein
MEKGIKQGDSLSPLLFAIFMDSILKHCKIRTPRMKIGNWNLRPVLIHALVYVDVVLIISDKKEYLQNAVIEWGSTFRERGLEINTAKSKIMKISKVQDNEEVNIKWNETTLEVVKEYNYLGVIITNDGKTDKEINNRTKKANQIYYEINNTVLGKKERLI